MKYLAAPPFYNHLRDMASQVPSSVYLIVAPASFERKVFAEKIAAFLKGEMIFFNLGRDSFSLVLNELNTVSMFDSCKIVYVDEVDKLKTQDFLIEYVKNPLQRVFLILGAAHMKGVSALYQAGKKEIVALDLSEEKSWEKESRLLHFITEEVQKEGKIISQENSRLLLHCIGKEPALLAQEIRKLICFVGERSNIEKRDIQEAASMHNELLGWPLAEQIVWGNSVSISLIQIEDIGFLLPLMGQIRFLFQQGYQLALLHEEGVSSVGIGSKFPQIKGKKLDSYLTFIKQKGSRYFKKGLTALFNLEIHVKSSALSLSCAFDLFLAEKNRG